MTTRTCWRTQTSPGRGRRSLAATATAVRGTDRVAASGAPGAPGWGVARAWLERGLESAGLTSYCPCLSLSALSLLDMRSGKKPHHSLALHDRKISHCHVNPADDNLCVAAQDNVWTRAFCFRFECRSLLSCSPFFFFLLSPRPAYPSVLHLRNTVPFP